MSRSALDELAYRYGIVSHEGFRGEHADETKIAILRAFGIDAASAGAIEDALEASKEARPPEMRAPPGVQCYLPDRPGRAWGVSVQLYEIRSRRNWGMGDFADLAELCRIVAAAGADFVGTNPLHALFLADPSRCSPFSPSNRMFLDPLYIAVDRIPGFAATAGEAERAAELRGIEAVDHAAVAQLKLGALRRLWQSFCAGSGALPAAEFDAFRRRWGPALERHAMFEALSAFMVADGGEAGWRRWPEQYHDADGAAVRGFARQNAEEVRFHEWLQWLADRQLSEACHAASEAGMRIGLYLDFAVGEVPDGSARWSDRAATVPGMCIGAPPDVFSAQGQDWGLAPVSPSALAENGFAGFRQAVTALSRHAGALRIDHAMSLWQLFHVPEGGRPADGAYVRNPLPQLLAVLAEVSRNDRTIIIGEDLGIVPPGFRDVMQQCRILSYRILYFEQRDSRFIAPHDYPELALACLSTHDLPTLVGWWRGDDIRLRREHGLIEDAMAGQQADERIRERRALIEAMENAGALDHAGAATVRTALTDPEAALPSALVVAAHRLIAMTPCLLASIRIADLTGESRPTNLPGTVDTYPNWRLKSSVTLEDLAGLQLFREVTSAMSAERPRS